jgi:hypothetical protein
MKRFWGSFLIIILLLAQGISLGAETAADISALTTKELNTLTAEINTALERHHTPDKNLNVLALSVVQSEVESHFTALGIDVTWAWINYSYTREWDFYTVSTHIDYKDKNGKSQKADVYAELFPQNGHFAVYYLLIGKETILNRREALPAEFWVKRPEKRVNQATGLDLSVMGSEALRSLKTRITGEMKAHHTPVTATSNLVLSLTKYTVEQYFLQRGTSITWAWINYEYTRDWDFYTVSTHIDYADKNGTWHKPDVYAEAYPTNSHYDLYYLTVGDQVILDERSRLPEKLYDSPEPEMTAITPEPAPEAEPGGAAAAAEIPAPAIQEGMADYVSGMNELMDLFDGMILDIKAVNEDNYDVISVIVGDVWYELEETHKDRFVEIAVAGIQSISAVTEVSFNVSVYFYDGANQPLAMPKLTGGYQIMR